MKREWWIAIIVIAMAAVACVCFGFAGMYGLRMFYDRVSGEDWFLADQTPTATPIVFRPTPEPTSSTGVLRKEITQNFETLEQIENTEIPVNDLRDIVSRLGGNTDIPLTVSESSEPLSLGTQELFWVSNVDTNEYTQIEATLEAITDHVYLWIQEGVPYNAKDAQLLAETFESQIYLRTKEFFGSEWSPGIDGDPHVYVLFIGGIGTRLVGYFSSADEQHPLAHEYSNAHELITLNSDNLTLDQEYTLAVLVHEYQHLIHWNQDRDESSWVNEGLSELAVFINGYLVGSEYSYISNPDIQLNDWPNSPGSTSPHYGASFLFLIYFLDRFGEEATKLLVRNPANGLAGIDRVLEEIDAHDPITGEVIGANEVFLDWVIASFLKDRRVSDGRYIYNNFPDAPQAAATETIDDCPQATFTRDVHQFGVDYIQIACKGEYVLRFEGSVQASVVPADVYSGQYYVWSNKGDEADMTLTRSFDFRDHDGPLTLTYWTWYDIEADYDYVYLEVSKDGESWEILTTPSGTHADPSGNNHGWGYNGESGGWVQEEIDLSEFAGEVIQIRFEYITDAAVNGEGMLIDDIAIPEIGYYTGFEHGLDNWQAAGWIRMDNVLPQNYGLALITFGDETEVSYIPLEGDLTAEIPLRLNDGINQAVLVVTGKTRYTRDKAAYRIEIK
jgi:hypothetical protein